MLKGEEKRYNDSLQEGRPGPLDWNPSSTRSPGYMNPEVKDAIDKTTTRQKKLEEQMDHLHERIMGTGIAEDLLKLIQAQKILCETKEQINKGGVI